jgi:SMI1/KNR4 family protein SUKH-1
MDTRRLPDLIQNLLEAQVRYERLAFDEENDHPLGPPCTPQQIRSLEKRLGNALPPSYRAFMERHNGWTNFAADAKLLAVEDHSSDWVKDRLLDMQELFPDTDQEDPFQQGAMLVLIGEDSDEVLYVDPRTMRPDGEMDFVALDIVQETQRFPDFISFLEYKLDLFKRLIDRQTKGIAAEGESEE